jgi:hypothetical protein
MESEERTATTQREAEAGHMTTAGEDERPSTADIAAGANRDATDDGHNDREATSRVEEREPLLDQGATSDVRGRWEEIQAGFVDEPRNAVQEADALVADLMQRLADSFASERQALEGQWDRGDEVSTEELRVALQRYRSFFDRLLSA